MERLTKQEKLILPPTQKFYERAMEQSEKIKTDMRKSDVIVSCRACRHEGYIESYDQYAYCPRCGLDNECRISTHCFGTEEEHRWSTVQGLYRSKCNKILVRRYCVECDLEQVGTVTDWRVPNDGEFTETAIEASRAERPC